MMHLFQKRADFVVHWIRRLTYSDCVPRIKSTRAYLKILRKRRDMLSVVYGLIFEKSRKLLALLLFELNRFWFLLA